MTPIEILLIIVLAIVVLFLVYFFLRGSTGRVSISRPVESRVDEYLDRKFERMIEEWSLVRRPALQAFKRERNEVLDRDEQRIHDLKQIESEMNATLQELEGRLNALEETLGSKESPGRW